jgi:hypothetical protein
MPRTQEMDGAEVPEAFHEWQQIPSPLPQNTPTELQFGLGWESETVPTKHQKTISCDCRRQLPQPQRHVRIF